jgi:hypothetical protein
MKKAYHSRKKKKVTMTFESEKKNCLSPLLHQIGFLVTFEREREIQPWLGYLFINT